MKTITLRLPEDLHRRAKVKVATEHTTLQHVLEEAVRAYVGDAPADPDFQRQMEIARQVMDKYKTALAELAK